MQHRPQSTGTLSQVRKKSWRPAAAIPIRRSSGKFLENCGQNLRLVDHGRASPKAPSNGIVLKKRCANINLFRGAQVPPGCSERIGVMPFPCLMSTDCDNWLFRKKIFSTALYGAAPDRKCDFLRDRIKCTDLRECLEQDSQTGMQLLLKSQWIDWIEVTFPSCTVNK
jgi:hypothetical protein